MDRSLKTKEATNFRTVDSCINLEQVDPINPKRVVAFINHWIHGTVRFLNEFSNACESKLLSVENKLALAEDSLAILESKLASIPDLDDVTLEKELLPNFEAKKDEETVKNTSKVPIPEEPEAALEDKEPTNDKNTSENIDVIPVESVNPISKDPTYATYFKMVAVGVPVQAVKLKMINSGLDPSLLDDPNAPAP